MRKSSLLILLALLWLSFSSQAQGPHSIANFTHGPSVALHLIGDDGSNEWHYTVGGELGWFVEKKVAKVLTLQSGLGLYYSSNTIQNATTANTITAGSSLQFCNQEGTLDYNNLSLRIPLLLKVYLFKRKPMYLLGGFAGVIALADNTDWQYDEFKVEIGQAAVPGATGLSQSLEQSNRFIDTLIGVGGHLQNWRLNLLLSAGNRGFQESNLSFSRYAILLNAQYQL